MLNGLLTGAYRRDCWLRVVEMEQVAALSRSWSELTQPRCQGGVGVMEGQRGFLSESLLHWTPVTARLAFGSGGARRTIWKGWLNHHQPSTSCG